MFTAAMDFTTAAPYVAAGVALIVGVVNPWVTNRLAARRQGEQLEHDRAMRRREEIITVIGDATAAVSRRFYLAERGMDLWRSGVAWEDPQTSEVQDARITAVDEVRRAWAQIEIRFEAESAPRERFNEWRSAIDDYSNAIRLGHRTGRPYVQDRTKVEERHDIATHAADRWLEAARAAVVMLDRGATRPGSR